MLVSRGRSTRRSTRSIALTTSTRLDLFSLVLMTDLFWGVNWLIDPWDTHYPALTWRPAWGEHTVSHRFCVAHFASIASAIDHQKYNPGEQKGLRTIFLKPSNHMGGR